MNLNKACPMHPYPLPRITYSIKTTFGYQYLSFLNTFLRYNKIPTHEPGQIHLLFIPDKGL